MQLTDILAQVGGIESIARELGISEAQARRGAEALAPAVIGGFRKQAEARPGGLEDLIGGLGGGGLLDEVLAPRPTDLSRGNDVLGQIFGSKEVSRAVAERAQTGSGLNPDVLKQMLPMLAMVVSGFLAKQQPGAQAGPAGPGGLGDLLGGLLGGQGRAGNAGGLAAMLDADGDGNPLDDILDMLGGPRHS